MAIFTRSARRSMSQFIGQRNVCFVATLTAAFVIFVIYQFVTYHMRTRDDVESTMAVVEYGLVRSSQVNYKPTEDSKHYNLRIIAIVYNRANSLTRLLNSLNRAHYENDTVKLEVWIDRSKDGGIDEVTLSAAQGFHFLHGEYSVNVHKQHVGIYGQWLQTWQPHVNSSEIGVILEDDLVVSPHFYRYLKLVHNKYDSNPQINGFALQGISIKHNGAPGLVEAPSTSEVYQYPVVGTWGYSPSPQNWIKFIEWYNEAKKNTRFVPDVPGNVASSWYRHFIKANKTDSMWSMWYIYYAWKQNEFTVYPYFGNHTGLTCNYKEKGLHYSGGVVGPSNPVLDKWTLDYDQLPDNPVKLDIGGKVIP